MEVRDEENIGTLNSFIEYERFTTIRTTMDTISLHNVSPIEYYSYLKSMLTHAENLKSHN